MTRETWHFSFIAPKVPFFTAQKITMYYPENNNVLTLKKIFGREKKANIADTKYYKNGNV